ncbi:uncharacterized protein LOC105187007 isoform X2 [Harpegnathos saltator]|uniref:uncharacterized protein LOC105187007 isoform X2 n=1 Tax=Harpegnathos saltator TaxID=610380 RepID=UPI000DBED617|nr:uncharacterized protein LOC105187007 isoform X2 [Harpegnathos saltator]
MSTKYVTRTSPSKEMVLVGEMVEVIVKKQDKTKRSENTPIKSTSNITGQKGSVEKKKSTPVSSRRPQNWGQIFGNQNLLYMKQVQSSKSTKHTENKEVKKSSNGQELQKNRCNHNSKNSDAASSKRTSSQKKVEELKTCISGKSSSSSTNNIQSVLVQDRAVQIPELNNGFYRFDDFNPVRALCFLMKELEDSVAKDKRTIEIFNEMEQILCRIPISFSPRISALEELDIMSIQSKLEKDKIKLQEYSEQMKAKCELWMSEREKFRSQIQKQDARLKEADQQQTLLENHIKALTHQLEEAAESKDKTVSTLKQQIKDDEKVISELRTELTKQTKLARERYIKNQCMIIEKEKLSVLSSYKDTLNVELRNTIKLVHVPFVDTVETTSSSYYRVAYLLTRYREFQNLIAEQSTALKEEYINGGGGGGGGGVSSPPPLSPVNTGPACSSPNLSFTEDGHGLSDISLSVVERMPQERVLKGNAASKDSAAHFVSLAIGESSHTLIPKSFQKQGANDEEMLAHHCDKSDVVLHRNANMNHGRKSSHQSSRRDHNSDNVSSKPITCDMEKQIQSKLDDTQHRMSVDVPSPLRDCPPPDWSDSLSSVNTTSDLDIVPSTDI